MKKLIVAVAVVGFSAAAATSAFAEASGAGCGAGSIIFKGQQGILPQTLAATTNGISANQLFGISTGTLGCSPDGVVLKEHERNLYAGVNFDNLLQDVARGEGEYLESLATVMDVAPADREAFYAFAKEQFDHLAASPDTTSEEFLVALDDALASNQSLSRYAIH